MHINAYITVNGSKPSRSLHSFVFEKAKVSDLCVFAAEKTFCPPTSTFTVSVKGADSCLYNLDPGADLVDKYKEEMFVTIDPPLNDSSSFLLPTSSQPRTTPSTPVLSQSSFASLSVSTPSGSSSSTQRSVSGTATAFATPGAPISFAEENFMDQVNSILANGDGSVPSSSSDPDPGAPVSPNTLLLAVYYSDREKMDGTFKEMKPEEPALLNKVNVFDFFNTAARKAALIVLKSPRDYNLEVLAGAKVVCKKALVDLLVDAYPSCNCPSNACLPATKFLAAATGNPWFCSLTTTDGTNLIVNAFRKRTSRFRTSQNPPDPSTPKAKRRKRVEPFANGDLEAAVLAFSRCTTPVELKNVVAETAKVRSSWVKKMESEKEPQIPEAFFKKFPIFASDASLLHEDYKVNMSVVRGLPVVDFGEAFKKMIPAIFVVAKEHKLIPEETTPPTTSDADAWIACSLLIRLIPKYCKKNTNCKPERLFVEAWDLTSINAMHQTRREIKQTAPMIFVLTNYGTSKRTYLVSTDDIAIEVKGTLCDAIQSLMELHHIFDLAYAKEMKPFFVLLEKFGEVDPSKGYSTLLDLYFDLKMAQGNLEKDPVPMNETAASEAIESTTEPAAITEEAARLEESDPVILE